MQYEKSISDQKKKCWTTSSAPGFSEAGPDKESFVEDMHVPMSLKASWWQRLDFQIGTELFVVFTLYKIV